jgi:hypothetical protein
VRALAAAAVVLLAGCGGDGHRRVAAPAGCPEAKPVLQRTILEGSWGWAFGRGPVYVSFLDKPAYRGKGTTVAIYRDTERNGGYGVKVMTILSPRFAGEVRQEVSAVTPGRRAGFSLGRGSSVPIEDLLTTREFEVRRSDELVPGGIIVSGPGCYRLALEAQGRRYAFSFPVRFEPAERRVASTLVTPRG